MSEEIFWVVYEEEKKTRKWVDMPKDYIGSPLYEHATDYITVLETGERVMVRKKDGFVFENSGVSSSDKGHLMSPEEIDKMREEARRKAEERRRKGLQGKSSLIANDLSVPLSRKEIFSKGLGYPNSYGRKVAKRGKGNLVGSKNSPTLREIKQLSALENNDYAKKSRKAKSIPIEQIVKNRYDEKVSWVVDLDSSRRNRWYPMPIDFKGKPTFESWDSYVAKLSDGRKVAISKKTNEIVNEGTPVKVKVQDKGSSKHKPIKVNVKSEEADKGSLFRKPKRKSSTGLKVISSKEELLELQAKSKSSKEDAQTKKKGVKSNVTTS